MEIRKTFEKGVDIFASIDTRQDKITSSFSGYFAWIIAENQASNYLLMKHDKLKWIDLKRMKRERLRNRQLSLFEGCEQCEKEEQNSVETGDHDVFFRRNQSGHRDLEANFKREFQPVTGRKKSGIGIPLPNRSA